MVSGKLGFIHVDTTAMHNWSQIRVDTFRDHMILLVMRSLVFVWLVWFILSFVCNTVFPVTKARLPESVSIRLSNALTMRSNGADCDRLMVSGIFEDRRRRRIHLEKKKKKKKSAPFYLQKNSSTASFPTVLVITSRTQN